MAYDQDLTDRILACLGGQPTLEQKRMFGGISFMVQGNFVCGVVKNDMCVRVGNDAYEDALARPGVREMDFTKRPMKGWVFVAQEAVADEASLRGWVDRALTYALSLPPK